VYLHLQTDRLTIRRFTAADEDNLVTLNSDPEVMRYIPGSHPGRAELRDEIIPFHLAAYGRHPGLGTWAAEDAATGEFLGWFHLRPRRGDGAAELGYRLRPAAWGRGYATEGSRALIDEGFTELGLDRIVAEVMPGNLGSRRVLEKCGLTLLHADPGHVEYELTRDSWATARQARR
jgi:RimJ/RimL family protein N-acetyltransferase